MREEEQTKPGKRWPRSLGGLALLLGVGLAIVIVDQSGERGDTERLGLPARDEQSDTPRGDVGRPRFQQSPSQDSHSKRAAHNPAQSLHRPGKFALGRGFVTNSKKPLGQLRQTGERTWVSTAGLVYGPGSREGDRLAHVLLHTRDQPDRPGSHGVFHGGRPTALAVIDEAYAIAQPRGPPTRVRVEGGRTIYTVDLGRTIGYVGGRTGARRDHPATRHVRLVLEGNRVITAFPLTP